MQMTRFRFTTTMQRNQSAQTAWFTSLLVRKENTRFSQSELTKESTKGQTSKKSYYIFLQKSDVAEHD